jgi:hypothetical protein
MPEQLREADGMPNSSWTLAQTTVLPDGGVGLHGTRA